MTTSVWNTDNIRDVAESVGITSMSDEVAEVFARDVEFRITEVLLEAIKFMRHGKRTTLGTQDISQALRVLNVEPLYGYESTRPLRFGEASLGPGQPLFYVEDEEVDFEKLINAPLPKVPREISLTAHWLAVEGVQPSIPQNPTPADSRTHELLPKGPGASSHLAAASGADNVSVKPLVKHVLSDEATQLFQRICSALLDETNEEWRMAAFASLRSSPSLHQLIPYLVEFVNEQVTHRMKDLFVLTQMMHAVAAMLENPAIYLDPYVASIVPPVLTCLVGKRLGPSSSTGASSAAAATTSNPPFSSDITANGAPAPAANLAHFALRDLAATILASIAARYSRSSSTLKPRIARTCLKHFLDPHKPPGAHYGAISALRYLAGAEGVRGLVLPNLRAYDAVLADALNGGGEQKRVEAEMVVGALLLCLQEVERAAVAAGGGGVNGHAEGERLRERLAEKIGDVLAERVVQLDRPEMVRAILEADTDL